MGHKSVKNILASSHFTPLRKAKAKAKPKGSFLLTLADKTSIPWISHLGVNDEDCRTFQKE